MSNDSIERKKLTLTQTLKQLQSQAKQGQITREDELDIDYSSEIEFILSLRGWRLLCHIGKEYPYTIRFRSLHPLRLIGSKDYKRVKPSKFIEIAKQTLLH